MAPFADSQAVDVNQMDPEELAGLPLRRPPLIGSPGASRIVSLAPVGPGSASDTAAPRTSIIAKPDLSPGVNLPPVGQPAIAAGRGGAPMTGAPALSAAPAGLPRDMANWENLKASPSGIAKLHATAKNPFVHTLENVGIGGLKALDTVGSMVAPGLAASIPGTTLHHRVLENQAAARVGEDVGEESKRAQSAKDIAEARKADADANAKPVDSKIDEYTDANGQRVEVMQRPDNSTYERIGGKVQEKTGQGTDVQALHDLMTGDNGQPRVNPQTGKPYTYLEAFTAVKQAGQKPSGNFEEQAYQEWHATHPNGTREQFARQHAADLRAPREGSWIPLEDEQGNPVLYNPTTRQTQTLPTGFKAKGAGHVDAATKEKILTYWQPALDSAERFNVMARNYQDAVKDHDQQAMLSLLANHLGMTMGLQKGSRLTRDIIHEAEQSRPWLQGLQAKFDKNGYLTGVVLTPQQMAQMMTLAEGRYSQDVAKSRSMAGYVGVADEPDRKLSREGAAYYLSNSNGDKQKARDAARADGWQF
ncbi:MAG TPA: hypothetical protein VJ756_02115 [Terriglobales bacterium]|nr:hypothetical protein [Terriglobales bacterium]